MERASAGATHEVSEARCAHDPGRSRGDTNFLRWRAGNYFSPGQSGACPLNACPRIFRDYRRNHLDACVHEMKQETPTQPGSGTTRRVAGGARTSQPEPRGPDASRRLKAALRTGLLDPNDTTASTCRSERPESNAPDDTVGREPAALSLASGIAPSPSLRSPPSRGHHCRIWCAPVMSSLAAGEQRSIWRLGTNSEHLGDAAHTAQSGCAADQRRGCLTRVTGQAVRQRDLTRIVQRK